MAAGKGSCWNSRRQLHSLGSSGRPLQEVAKIASSIVGGMWSGAETPPQELLALSLSVSRYNVEVKHIKIMTAEGLYRITEKKAFRGLVVRANLPPNPRPPESGQDCP